MARSDYRYGNRGVNPDERAEAFHSKRRFRQPLLEPIAKRACSTGGMAAKEAKVERAAFCLPARNSHESTASQFIMNKPLDHKRYTAAVFRGGDCFDHPWHNQSIAVGRRTVRDDAAPCRPGIGIGDQRIRPVFPEAGIRTLHRDQPGGQDRSRYPVAPCEFSVSNHGVIRTESFGSGRHIKSDAYAGVTIMEFFEPRKDDTHSKHRSCGNPQRGRGRTRHKLAKGRQNIPGLCEQALAFGRKSYPADRSTEKLEAGKFFQACDTVTNGGWSYVQLASCCFKTEQPGSGLKSLDSLRGRQHRNHPQWLNNFHP